MRVLHVTRSLSITSGGTAEAVRALCLGLSAEAVSNEVLVLDPKSAAATSTVPSGIVHWLGQRIGGYGYCTDVVPWLRMNQGRFDAIIVHGLWQYGGLAVWRASRGMHQRKNLREVPYYVYPHGMLDPWFKQSHPLKHLKKWLYWPWAEYRVLRDARSVLFTSETERLLARRSFWLYDCREKIVALGIEDPANDAERQVALFYRAYPEIGRRPFLLFLGRIHQKKGLEMLVRAYAAVLSEKAVVPPHLVIAGGASGTGDTSEHEGMIKKLVGDLCPSGTVTFTGMVHGDLKWGALHACEAFILPSHQENFGIAVVEALACGKPVLISDQVNIWREIEADGAALVAQDTLTGTSELINRWITLSDLERHAMGNSARRCFDERFEIRKSVQLLLNELSKPKLEKFAA